MLDFIYSDFYLRWRLGAGHPTDPERARRTAQMVSDFADGFCEGRVLAGGAGGYQPRTWTPMCWATVARVLAEGVDANAKHVYTPSHEAASDRP